MAYIDIQKDKAPYSSNYTSFYTKGPSILDGKYRVQFIEDLWDAVPTRFYSYDKNNILRDNIAEGQQVYITEGSKTNEINPINHKGEIWVLIDKQNITKPIFEYNPETGIETKTEGPHGWRLLGSNSDSNLNWEQL